MKQGKWWVVSQRDHFILDGGYDTIEEAELALCDEDLFDQETDTVAFGVEGPDRILIEQTP